MRIPTILTIFATLTVQTASHDVRSNHILQTSLQNPHHAQTPHLKSTNDDREIPLATRIHWMRQTFHALNASGSPCPPYPFAAVIVNHTNTNPNTNPSSDNGSGNDITNASSALGELICTGVNQSRQMGNMVLHGEISAILNCTSILQDPVGKYKLSPAETVEAFEDLSLYTNAESCPMCASALRWNGFKEYIYGTSIARLVEYGFVQITISSGEVFAEAEGLPSSTALIGGVLAEETDRLFAWQFRDGACPMGCSRSEYGEGNCQPV